ncbi:MAG: LPS export ABC transporter permease LptF [Gammaproteobacteria bacterium]|nr:LPS export ABC transporter permease LptF [Gammaproteobacteria bacterium]
MIIDRYLITEIMQTMLAVLLVLLLIFMGRYFALFLSYAVDGDITASVVVDLLLLRTMSAFNMMLPFALYIAVLISFGRLYKDNEMTALAASGVSITRINFTIMGLGTFFVVVVAVIALWISPWADDKQKEMEIEAGKASIVESLSPGQFNQFSKRKDAVFYVGAIAEDRQSFQNVFLQMEVNKRMDVYSADHGYIHRDEETGDRYLVLVNGYRYLGNPGEQDFLIQEYEKYAVRLALPKISKQPRSKSAVPTAQLLQDAKPKDMAELQWRLSMPISTLLLAMLGLVISRTSPRQGRFAKLFVAILVYVIYNNLISVARSWIEQNKVPVEVGIWWVHLLLFVFIAILLNQQITGRWFKLSAS